MFAAIQILLDASVRSPELQALAREFYEGSARGPPPGCCVARPARRRAGRRPSPRESVLAWPRLDLLPDGAEPVRTALSVFDHRQGR
jgi:hypothetical protein